jgi:hypothetical protein
VVCGAAAAGKPPTMQSSACRVMPGVRYPFDLSVVYPITDAMLSFCSVLGTICH